MNGTIVREPGFRVDPRADAVAYNGNRIGMRRRFTYILLNKPRGVVCTVSDEKKRQTVFDLVDSDKKLFPVGRLDLNTTGLLLITDDGELSHRLMHPSFEIEKEYEAILHRPVTEEDKKRLEDEGRLGSGQRVECAVKSADSGGKRIRLSVHEGKYRMVRRLLETLGYETVALDRTGYAGLTKKNLPRGGWRNLTKSEILMLYKKVGLNSGYQR